jgi:hypothetical protein
MHELKKIGYSTYKIRQEKILGQATIQKLNSGGLPSWAELNKICTLLNCQPGDLVEYMPDKEK